MENKTSPRGKPFWNFKFLLLLVFLAWVCGCSRSETSSSENTSPGSALENLFAGSGEMEKTQDERRVQQEKMLQEQKELQKKRLDSYDPHR